MNIDAFDKAGSPGRAEIEDLQLQVGDRLQLERVSVTARAQHFTSLIGYAKGVSLMVATPEPNDGAAQLREGHALLVRGFSGRSAFAFESSVLAACLSPLAYLHLAYPESVRVTPVRSALRVRAGLVAAAQNLDRDGGRVPVACTVADLSVDGAQLESRQSLGESGERLQIFFRFVLQPNGYEVRLSPEASIQNARPRRDRGDDEMHTYGIRFEKLHTTESLLVQNFIQQIALTDRSRVV